MSEVYAVATVVGRQAPVSAHLGDRAVVHADGRMEGFVGGACSREIVRLQALHALHRGEPRLVRIRPDAPEIFEDLDSVTVPMTCTSEGAVDVYIEVHVPRRVMVIAGDTLVARALETLSPVLDFDVQPFDGPELTADSLESYLRGLTPAGRERCVAIAASQGRYDEAALAVFLQFDLAFVGLLASRRRGAAVAAQLVAQGIPPERVRAISNPVGLRIGARKPAEVAVSILAELVDFFAMRTIDDVAEAIDPVCGMGVARDSAQHRFELDGRTYYFCCSHCRTTFERDPDPYLAAASL